MQNAFLDRQQKALAELAELVARRAAGEQDIDRRHAARSQEIVDQHKGLRERLTAAPATVLMSGFGIGLSWGSCIVRTEGIVMPELASLNICPSPSAVMNRVLPLPP